ncbi:ABC transporter ATP-binding protein [Saprospiraceae bacterium]|nr:ABC transporter ATP-binding protein [Saprospiraceae bacterium]
MNAIEINQLNFSYNKKEPLLHDVSMSVPQGGIYGFLGPNGAGKTTTLKLILNLLKHKGNGTINILGIDTSKHYPAYLKEIGSLVEDPSIYHHLTAKANLKIWSNYYNCEANRVEEVLEIIGLTHAANKKVQAFSTGMKQRLGIGIAILHDPKILILDEPTNGLDPIGINDLRMLMHKLTSDGKTIILSSHILSEVEKIVDHVGIIKDGRIIYEGPLEQLNNRTNIKSKITIYVDNCEKAKKYLEKHFPTIVMDDQLQVDINSRKDINQIVRIIIDNDIQLYELIKPKINLETIFMNLAK